MNERLIMNGKAGALLAMMAVLVSTMMPAMI